MEAQRVPRHTFGRKQAEEISVETTAKLFTDGRSQAVRIPKAYQFEGVDEVILRKEGDALIIIPARKSWTSFADEVSRADDDFMAERPDLMDDRRAVF